MRRSVFLSAGFVFALALAACGPKPADPAPAPAPAPGAAPAVESAPPPSSSANGLAPDGYPQRLVASGASPSWRVQVGGESLEYSLPDASGSAGAARNVSVFRSAYASGVYFEGKEGELVIGLDIANTPCSLADGSRGAFSATLKYGEQTYTGCAEAAP